MLSSFVKYFILVHSVCATCKGGAKNDNACKTAFASEEVVMVQRVAAKVILAQGAKDHVVDLVGQNLDTGLNDQLASIFSMAVSKLEAMTGFDIDGDGSVGSKTKLENSERKEPETTDKNQTENKELIFVEAESKVAESKVAERKETERQEADSKQRNKIQLMNVSEVLSKPKHVLEALNLKFRSLEEAFSEIQRNGTEAIMTQAAEYEETLSAQRNNNMALAKKNQKTSARISTLNVSNEDLRSRAQRLTKQCVSLTAELKVLQANISNAHEFIGNVLGTSAEKLSMAPQLRVLEELAQKDADMEKNRDHQNRLNQVSVAKLQAGASVSKPDAIIDVESLNSDLHELSKKQNGSAASLKDAFEKTLETGEQHHNELLTEGSKLSAAETAALELKDNVAMLQISSSVSKPYADIDVRKILESLNFDLHELFRKQNASAASLKDAFEKVLEAGEQHHNELLTEESKLSAAETASLELKERLTAAVKHLEQAREELLQKSQNVRHYVQLVGAHALEQEVGPALPVARWEARARKRANSHA